MSTNYQLDDLDLAALLSSRVCHDVISPVGAITNGLELLEMDDDEAMRTDFLHAPPLHEVTTEAYLIERTEVTFGEWLAYLRELPPDERDVHRPSIPTVTLADTAGKFTLLLQPNGTRYRAVEGELLHYQQHCQWFSVFDLRAPNRIQYNHKKLVRQPSQ